MAHDSSQPLDAALSSKRLASAPGAPRFWSVPAGELLRQLETTPQGLTGEEAGGRLRSYGAILLKPRKRSDALGLLLSQLSNPITAILIFAAALSFFLADSTDAIINMFSMAGASLFLPFLPLLPKQILLTNLLTDFPEMAIATDSVDGELVEKPRRWDIKFIRNFMLVFGSVSSVFDFLTFGLLIFILRATPDQFRTGWFLESVISASIIVLVIRTRQPFFRSVPGKYLSVATLLVACATLALPFTPLGGVFGFGPVPAAFLLVMGGIVLWYVAAAEAMKRVFYGRRPAVRDRHLATGPSLKARN